MTLETTTNTNQGKPQIISLSSDDFAVAEKNTGTQVLSRPSLSYWKDAWIRLKKNKQSIVALVTVILVVLATLFGPLLYQVDPAEQVMGRVSEGPSFGKHVTVIDDSSNFKDTILEGVEASPTFEAAKLEAATTFELTQPASSQGVALKWSPVKGASGYAIYRATEKPTVVTNLGVPITEITAGNQVTYLDNYDLKEKHYFYSVIAKNVEEAPTFKTLEVRLTEGILLTDAQSIDPNAKIGDSVKIPAKPFGTDALGRDLLSRLISGGRVSLFIGFFAPFLSVLIGVAVGGISGYFGGKTDNWIMRFTDFVMALPFLLFMILFKVVFGAGPGEDGIGPMLVSLVALSWTGPTRLTRGQILQLRESEFVQASRLLGAKPLYLIFRHLLPNTLGVILVSLTFSIPSAIFTEAFLSFIGMGVAPPTASWGSMCNDGVKSFLTTPHEFIFPAAIIAIVVLAFNILGDGLRDALDPKMRSIE